MAFFLFTRQRQPGQAATEQLTGGGTEGPNHRNRHGPQGRGLEHRTPDRRGATHQSAIVYAKVSGLPAQH